MKTYSLFRSAMLPLCGALLFLLCACSEQTTAQDNASAAVVQDDVPARANDKPRASPNAAVSQTIGTTVVSITYGSPAVKGREVFGGLEAYGKVWRAGANEATVISFTGDVTVNGEALPAGTYALFAIPGESEWTLIFNGTPNQWGAYDYDAGKDVLRVMVDAQEAPHAEWLRYGFDDLKATSAQAYLHWSTVKVPFTISAK